MPRKGHVPKRVAKPDPIYNSELVTKIIGKMMLDGKRNIAESIMYSAMDIIKEKTGNDPLEVMPQVEVKPRRVGGATYQVPVEVRPERKTALGIRWIVSYSRDRNEHTMAERLAAEIMDAANGQGGAVKKREDTHRMAEANKAFAHYRW